MVDFNLIPAHRVDARRRNVGLRRWAIVCIAYAAVLGAGYGVCRGVWVDSRDLDEELAETARQIDESNQAIDVLGQELATARLMLDSTMKVVDQPDWSVLLALIGRTLGDQIVLKRCQLQQSEDQQLHGPATRHSRRGQQAALLSEMPDAFTLALNGYGRSPESVSEFVLRLEQVGLFKRVAVLTTNREPFMSGEAIAFEIACTLGDKGASDQ